MKSNGQKDESSAAKHLKRKKRIRGKISRSRNNSSSQRAKYRFSRRIKKPSWEGWKSSARRKGSVICSSIQRIWKNQEEAKQQNDKDSICTSLKRRRRTFSQAKQEHPIRIICPKNDVSEEKKVKKDRTKTGTGTSPGKDNNFKVYIWDRQRQHRSSCKAGSRASAKMVTGNKQK